MLNLFFDFPVVLGILPAACSAVVGGAMIALPIALAVLPGGDDDSSSSDNSDDSGSYDKNDFNNDVADVSDAVTDLYDAMSEW